MLRNTDRSWGTPAKLLHWVVAGLVFLQISTGWAAVLWSLSPTKLDLFVWHKSTGMLILVLMVVRASWRWADGAPSLPAAMPPRERIAAHLTHHFLYALLFLLPITGWIVHSAAAIPFQIFWLIPLPTITHADEATADAAARLHFALFVLFALLVAGHVAAALRHHYFQRDDVLARMLPGRGSAR